MDQKVIDAVAADSGLSTKSVQKVIDSLESVVINPIPGTIIRNPATGDVAVRVHQYAETYWRVTSLDDRSWVETELLGWDALFDPAKAAVVPATTEGEVQ